MMDIDGGTKSYGEYLDKAAKLIKIELSREFKAAGADLTPEQWVLLSKLYKNTGQSQASLGTASYKDAPTVSRIIDLLCKKGYTERKKHPEDRRSFNIEITDLGIATVEKVIPIIHQARDKGWVGLNDKDYEDLLRIVNKISENFSS